MAETSTAHRPPTAGWAFWLWWTGATTAAFALGAWVTASLAQFPVTGDLFGLATAGILATALQTPGLWRRVSGAAWWILTGPFAAFILILVVFARGGGDNAEVGWVAGAALYGTVAGGLQWWVLRGRVTGAAHWIAISTGAWLLGLGAGEFGGLTHVGAVYGAGSGAGLAWLLRRPRPAGDTSSTAVTPRPAWRTWVRRGFQAGGVAVAVGIVGLFGFGIRTLLSFGGDPVLPLYAEHCATCHGENLAGAAQGPALVGGPLTQGETVAALVQSIRQGAPERNMPAWSATLTETQIRTLAILIAERRADLLWNQFRMDRELAIPTRPVETELVSFRLETVVTGIDPYAFSIAPLPDGRILVTEKTRGLSVVSPDGLRSAPIAGTPQTSAAGTVRWGLDYGAGWLLDVQPHPDFATNGWIYLHHTELCDGCTGLGTKTMNRVVRGRIRDGTWVDEEVIWEVPEVFYNATADIGAGGRLAFDTAGHLYLSVGARDAPFATIQDLGTPYGKIHRVRDDGSIPADNPFVNVDEALPSIWTYGHRNPQGLEFDPNTGTLWSSEMGPRGGDEINILLPGRNYGWPLYTLGVDYDGDPIDFLDEAGLAYEDIEQPVVDITPSTAVSSFIIYDGDAFPAWRGDFLVGSLIGTQLYRFEIEGDSLVHTEIVLPDLARIRDIEMGTGGLVYLLLEHESGSRIVRLVPDRSEE